MVRMSEREPTQALEVVSRENRLLQQEATNQRADRATGFPSNQMNRMDFELGEQANAANAANASPFAKNSLTKVAGRLGVRVVRRSFSPSTAAFCRVRSPVTTSCEQCDPCEPFPSYINDLTVFHANRQTSFLFANIRPRNTSTTSNT